MLPDRGQGLFRHALEPRDGLWLVIGKRQRHAVDVLAAGEGRDNREELAGVAGCTGAEKQGLVAGAQPQPFQARVARRVDADGVRAVRKAPEGTKAGRSCEGCRADGFRPPHPPREPLGDQRRDVLRSHHEPHEWSEAVQRRRSDQVQAGNRALETP